MPQLTIGPGGKHSHLTDVHSENELSLRLMTGAYYTLDMYRHCISLNFLFWDNASHVYHYLIFKGGLSRLFWNRIKHLKCISTLSKCNIKMYGLDWWIL